MAVKKVNVLIFPAGAENAIEIYRSIRYSIHVNAFGASSRDDISHLIYDCPILHLPPMDAPDFLDRLEEVVAQHDIEVIFPTHDSAALFLAQHRDRIAALIANSDPRTNEICRHKRQTYALFEDQAFCPDLHATPADVDAYPLFAKPDIGQGAKGARLVRDAEEHRELAADPGLLFLEYLPGREFTVDCFTDRTGKLLFAGARERVEIRMGISFRSREAETTREIQAIAECINSRLALRGLWFFQLRAARDGTLKLLEVSTRAAGTGGYFRHKGVNLPLLTIFDLLERSVEIRPASYQVELFRSTVNYYRYAIAYDRIYVDLDDTLLVNGRVNDVLMGYLYAAQSRGKHLALITKHAASPEQTLLDHRIAPALFDEIIHVPPGRRKVEYITPGPSILIDNWYLERKEATEELEIPVFDVDAVDSLLYSL